MASTQPHQVFAGWASGECTVPSGTRRRGERLVDVGLWEIKQGDVGMPQRRGHCRNGKGEMEQWPMEMRKEESELALGVRSGTTRRVESRTTVGGEIGIRAGSEIGNDGRCMCSLGAVFFLRCQYDLTDLDSLGTRMGITGSLEGLTMSSTLAWNFGIFGSGHRIGTAEVESALVSHPQCAEAAVVGFEHEVKGQGIYAFVTLVEGAPYSEELRKSLILAVRNQIGAFAAPDKIHWAPGLPKTRRVARS
ncbi:hypothetical protein KSP40_PGU021824 [Platanthera guangdongensis]|uniref:AMP-binding enzyme C-terminal domain-containing protein n=1 Tax=Platanthera guangdongensis TaxID=2320717 RepID=A0ABR2N226_9ASPA